jgi:Domain of unknown function (DUF4124)
MRTLIFTLIFLAAPLALATTVYKWVDDDGVVHYSDQPHPNAQKLQVKDVQTYKSSPVTAGGPPTPPPPRSAGAYRGCAILQPPTASDYANIDSLSVVVQTDPALRAGDQIYVLLDGQALNGGAPTGAQFNLSPVDRGEHSLQAVVKASDGSVVCQTSDVTFNVHQPSVQNPVNPVRPH